MARAVSQSKEHEQTWYSAHFHDRQSLKGLPREFGASSSRTRQIAGFLVYAACFAIGSANAQPLEFSPSLRIIGFADRPAQGDISSDTRFSGYIGGSLSVKNIWQGGTATAQLEYADGDGYVGFGKAGVYWPNNTYSAVPRAFSDDDPEWSLRVTHEFNDNQSLSLLKWNVFELAEHTPIVGGQGKGGFQYAGINTPSPFIFPAYFVGAQYAYKTNAMNYTLFIYDTQITAGDGYWDDVFDDGVIFNGTATYEAEPGGLPGFYSLNLLWSTEKVTDYSTVPRDFPLSGPLDPLDQFIEETDGEGFAAIKFQQYLSYDPGTAAEGWGIFGEVGFATDGNPLDALFVLGVAGSSPIDVRGDDRWGLAWSRYNWNNGLIRLIEDEGGEFQDEWAAEAFYEAKINDIFRIGANIVYVRPGEPTDDDLLQFGIRFRATF